MPFTPEELAEMAAADAEIEATFHLEQEDLDLARSLDQEARLAVMSPEARKVAAQKRAYREANREKVAAQQRAYREANREKYNAYMREYMRKKKSAAAGCARPDSGRKD